MRLFIAVLLTEEIKDALCDAMQRLKRSTLRGNFTRRENLHLTLAFIGETTKTDTVKKAMNKLDAKQFSLTLSNVGRFKRDGGDIYWIGVEKSETLRKIHHQLYRELTAAGFVIDGREFKPHLTVAREVTVIDGFDAGVFSGTVPPMHMKVGKISLMKSERINGTLTYTEIYYVPLVAPSGT